MIPTGDAGTPPSGSDTPVEVDPETVPLYACDVEPFLQPYDDAMIGEPMASSPAQMMYATGSCIVPPPAGDGTTRVSIFTSLSGPADADNALESTNNPL
jgi:hypothetical protein